MNSRFTENSGILFAATSTSAVGSPENGRKPSKNKASAVNPNALAIRKDSLALGPLRHPDAIVPATDQAHEKPRHHIASSFKRAPAARVPLRGEVRVPIFHRQIMRGGRDGNKNAGRRLSSASGHSFPLPVLGCGCARIFCGRARPEAAHKRSRAQTLIPRCAVVTGGAQDSARGRRFARRDEGEEIYNVAWRSLGLRSR